ncbi:OmpA family protein [Sulfurospirillum arcachonense]|uniref:OmpA family protein n=1 Tax=Sulfurospirillum arcachonense TaxID=57666 RepID=UPI0004692538|nr:OmpA family protein [Sulfurospirillum arcachonense]
MKKILLCLVVVTTLAFAGQGDYKSEMTATVGGVKAEGNLDLENALNLGLRYGVYVEDTFFDMFEVGFERSSDVDYDNSSEDTDINRFFVNLVKEYDVAKDTALYALVGLGYENYRNPMFDNDDDGFFQYGIGVKQWITDQFALKAEVRHGINFDGDNNLFYNLGFVIPFGKKVKDEMPIKSEPVVEQKSEPVVIEEPKKVISVDDDKDGVLNENDKCPTTKMGKIVDKDGCVKIVRLHVNFAYDKVEISSSYVIKIQEVADFMNENEDYTVVLEGHTDSKGTEQYNQKLSEKRAMAVSKVLVDLGIAKERISTVGYGESKPIATNETEDGRAKNRRVDASYNK